MTSRVNYSASLEQARGNAVIAAIGAGAILEVRTGTQPAHPGITATGTLLASFTMGTPFGTATNALPSIITATAPAAVTIAATGTQTWFRIKTAGGVGCIDGSAGTSSADLIFPSTFVAGQLTSLPSFSIASSDFYAGAVLSDRINIGNFETDNTYVSRPLFVKWTNVGGDWVDALGVAQGTTAVASATVTSDWTGSGSAVTLTSLNISGINGDVMIAGVYGIGRWDGAPAVFIDGVPATAWWGDVATQISPVGFSSDPVSHYRNNVWVLNPTRGSVLSFYASAYVGDVAKVYKVNNPPILNQDFINPQTSTPTWQLDLTGDAAVNAACAAPGYYDSPIGNGGWSYATDSNGLPYIRVVIQGAPGYGSGIRSTSWRPYYGIRVTEFWTRFCVYLEDDVLTGIADGVKVYAGLSNETWESATELMVYRIDHGKGSAANPGLVGWVNYPYIAETAGAGFPPGEPLNFVTRTARWHCIEHYVKLNTAGVANGLGEIRINGHSTWSRNNIRYRDNAGSAGLGAFFNLFHGGAIPPNSDMHYRFARFAMSTTGWCGVPTELAPASTYPAWRAAMHTKDTAYSIAGTANMNGVSRNGPNPIDIWNGLAASDTAFYSPCGGGHKSADPTLWMNATYKLDLSIAAPQWTMLDFGSTSMPTVESLAYYPDGRPAARHSYYTPVVIKARNKVFMFSCSYAYGEPGGMSSAVDSFNLATNTWDAAGTNAGVPTFAPVLCITKHPITEDIYISHSGSFYVWTQATGIWTQYFPSGPKGNDWVYSPTLIDVSRNRLMSFGIVGDGYTGNNVVRMMDLTTKVFTAQPISGDFSAFQSYESVVHDLDNDRYLTIHGFGWDAPNNQVIDYYLCAIDPTTFAVTQLCAVSNAINGVSNRFAYFQQYHGVAYVPRYGADVNFIPTVNS